jgi:hypothetical protein
MKYNPQDLKATYEENSDGLTPEEFLKDRTMLFLQNLLETDNGKKLYRQTGPYWETLYPVFKKYAPQELLAEYERRAGPFDYFNEAVKAEYDYKDDLLNFMAALKYQETRFDTMQSPEDVHLIELDGEEYAYIPNQNIDQDQYFGRGDFFD